MSVKPVAIQAEEDLEAIWDYSFRQIGVVQADA
ncbi:type II toxin-antitoxin system RelE/ParE family toxin [Kluyvera sp. Nf5]|nr:type II toxin-antitoxin system RelE/ParE family toxin [Kluyvera sp. Nf5]